MPAKLRLAYIVHSLRSDWNNGNAHFLRGLLRELVRLGHQVVIFEPELDWSLENLASEPAGSRSVKQFHATYPELTIRTYGRDAGEPFWHAALEGIEVVILHEWNPPALAHLLLALRSSLPFRLLFHDTHHRASSSPDQIRLFGTDQFDGILAFGEVLSHIYRDRFGMARVWTLHEAADTSVFQPRTATAPVADVVWIGNWGDNERSAEIQQYLLTPAAALPAYTFTIYGVRYPAEGRAALERARVRYAGYLPNLEAPAVYAAARATVHIPRRQYAAEMAGIPTIRIFEALACGIPLVSAPWQDVEDLFRPGDFAWAKNGDEMRATLEALLHDPDLAARQAERGLETVLSRHTCAHRARQLTHILEELVS